MEEEGIDLKVKTYGPVWSRIQTLVIAPWFQILMTSLVVLYLMLTGMEIMLAFFQDRGVDDPLLESIDGFVDITNCCIVAVFLVETLARAAIHAGGWVGYFSSPWNILDLAVLIGCAFLEVVDYIEYLVMSEASTIVASVRLVSSLRTINMLHYNHIDNEILINRSLKATITELQDKCDAFSQDSTRLQGELDAKRHSIAKVEHDFNSIQENMMSVQSKSWGNLVPSYFSLELTNKRSKSRFKRVTSTQRPKSKCRVVTC
ncbi:hypothetical protein DSO57_1015474 [Entomophthora muscae]|uniref:Uncharacterized protein n=1 Tax=Entomophthora muscae TaxID=34485 RepID=A0ACC2TG08_9FUNG|nr:hypothetical protein DSO57_1015474 [Entomophthora muscae]